MSQLTPEKYDRLKQMLENLEPCMGQIENDSSRNFIQDQITRHQQYGERMFVSPKQWDWIVSVHDKVVGPLDASGKGESFDARRDTLGDDMDDEIPF